MSLEVNKFGRKRARAELEWTFLELLRSEEADHAVDVDEKVELFEFLAA